LHLSSIASVALSRTYTHHHNATSTFSSILKPSNLRRYSNTTNHCERRPQQLMQTDNHACGFKERTCFLYPCHVNKLSHENGNKNRSEVSHHMLMYKAEELDANHCNWTEAS
jgi:hypothetical protein